MKDVTVLCHIQYLLNVPIFAGLEQAYRFWRNPILSGFDQSSVRLYHVGRLGEPFS